MSSKAIHRHSACGEVLKKKKSNPKQKLLFLFRKFKLQFFEYIIEKNRHLAFALQLQSTDGDYFTD